MKYYTKELWKKMNAESAVERDEAVAQWEYNSKLYLKQFQKVKHHLPMPLLIEMKKYDYFHDYLFREIKFYQASGRRHCYIRLTNGQNIANISLYDIDEISINVNNFDFSIQGLLHWSYCEFEWVHGQKIRISVLCDPKNELSFRCKNIAVRMDYDKL